MEFLCVDGNGISCVHLDFPEIQNKTTWQWNAILVLSTVLALVFTLRDSARSLSFLSFQKGSQTTFL